MNNEQPRERKRLVGLTVIGSLLILGAVTQIRVIANYEWYTYTMGYLPPGWIAIRYFISWTQRILGIIVGAGLIAHRRWAGKIAIFLSIFDILTEYWRYPYQCFKNQTLMWDRLWGDMFAGWGYPSVHFSSYVLPAVITTYVLDVSFFSFILYYLTRPYVQERLI